MGLLQATRARFAKRGWHTSSECVAGIEFILTRKHMKNIRMRVKAPSGDVLVSAPHHTELADIKRFVASKSEWVLQAQRKIKRLLAEGKLSEPVQRDLEPLRKPMQHALLQLLPVWEQRIGVQSSGCSVRKMRTRWGSCNVRTRKIWLSLELADKPPELLEYVLVHELVHLLEASHNARFYRFMDTFMPDWRDKHQRLNPLARRRL